MIKPVAKDVGFTIRNIFIRGEIGIKSLIFHAVISLA
jgi:hypothetical protein